MVMYSPKFPKDKIHQMMAWGKYICWAYKQRENCEKEIQLDNNDNYPMFFLYKSQWYASLHVVVEGWESLQESDETIEKLLSEYKDFALLIKKCRNATYHYQKSILDKRISNSLEQSELFAWTGALLDEFIRYLYAYPLKIAGICIESINLQKDYFDCIGWFPDDHLWINWYDLFLTVFHYVNKDGLSELETTPANDIKIKELWVRLEVYNPNPYISSLSRLKSDR